MPKLTRYRFAASTFALSIGLSGAFSEAQITPRPAPPRADTPRSNDDVEPAADSRVGGALAPYADPVESAEIVDESYLPGLRDLEAAGDTDLEGPVFGGVITGISEGRITVRSAPRRTGVVTNQDFKVPEGTPVIANGRRASLDSLRKGQTVLVHAAPGDPDVAVRIAAATSPRDRGTDEEEANDESRPALDDSVNWEEHPVAPGLPGEERTARGTGGEEAVLPLGIEIFGPGQGALVTEMLADGPAAQAGVQIGDFITQVNGKPVGNPELIEELIFESDSDEVVLTVLRGGEVLQLEAQPRDVVDGALVTMPAIRKALANYAAVGQANASRMNTNRAAANAGAINPFGGTLANYDGNGVLITGEPGTLANGLQPNDVILDFNGQPITNRADLMNALRGFNATGENVPLSVRRGNQTMNLNLPASAFNAGTAANLDARARSLGRPSPAGTGAAAARAANGQAVPQGSSAVTGAAVQGGQTPRGAVQQGGTQQQGAGARQQGIGGAQQGTGAGTAQPQ